MGRARSRPQRDHRRALYESRVGGQRVLVCRFSHPSAHGALRWGDRLDAPYLVQVVEPTLLEAVGRL